MTGKGDEDMTKVLLKDAAGEIGVEPGYLRIVIGRGELQADKFSSRDWWVEHADLLAFDRRRRPRGRRLAESETADPEQERKRAYQREYRRQYRERQKEASRSSTRRGRDG